MRSEFGNTLKITVEGGSHGEYVSAKVIGLPKGINIDRGELERFMKRRQGGNVAFTTPRMEADVPEFESGVCGNTTDGTPLEVRIYNRNVRSSDYNGFADTPRPSHADYTAQMRYGKEIDLRGGGHFSARLTAPLCVIGGILKQALSAMGIEIGTHLYSVGHMDDEPFDDINLNRSDFDMVLQNELPTVSTEQAEKMKIELAEAARIGDSVGGVVEAAITGLPAGIGDPLYDGVENRIAGAIFGLGGVRGIEFGKGFSATRMRGSEHNDPFVIRDGRVETETNNAGGVLGGITTGMPVIFRVAFKPTASIALKQKTVSLSRMEETEIEIKGRHDACIAIRALPCVEAITAIVISDLIISRYGSLDIENG